MHHSLHPRANFEALQKEARKLLHDLKREDVTAAQRYRPLELLDGASSAGLADAQYLIARRYGFRSWKKLKQCLVMKHNKT
jgi:hypothetical protein